MMSAARRAWPALARRASRTAGRSSSSSSMRSAARVWARMAVSGWFSSWAMPAAISPSVPRRSMAATRACSRWRRASARPRRQAAAPATSSALAAAQASHCAQGQEAGVSTRSLRRAKGLAGGAQRFLQRQRPAVRAGVLARQQAQRLGADGQAQVGQRVGDVAVLQQLARVQQQAPAGRSHQPVARRVHRQRDGTTLRARLRHGGVQAGGRRQAAGPGAVAQLAQPQQLRQRRAQAGIQALGRGRMRQGGQRGQHRLVLYGLLAEHALGDAGALEKASYWRR